MKRLFVVHAPKDEVRVFINPEIEAFSDKIVSYEEGCLSIPGIFSEVLRPQEVRIKALDRSGNEFIIEPGDFLARVIQHEFDHLNGRLFYQHLKPRQQNRFLRAYEKNRGLPEESLKAEV